MNHRCVKGKSPKCVPFVSFDENKGFKPIKKKRFTIINWDIYASAFSFSQHFLVRTSRVFQFY